MTPKSEFECVLQDTEKSDFFDLTNFGAQYFQWKLS